MNPELPKRTTRPDPRGCSFAIPSVSAANLGYLKVPERMPVLNARRRAPNPQVFDGTAHPTIGATDEVSAA